MKLRVLWFVELWSNANCFKEGIGRCLSGVCPIVLVWNRKTLRRYVLSTLLQCTPFRRLLQNRIHCK